MIGDFERRLIHAVARHQRASLWPLLVLVFIVAFISSCSTLALSAATSSTVGWQAPIAAGVAAVRATDAAYERGMRRAPIQPSSPASEDQHRGGQLAPRFTTQVTLPREDPASTSLELMR